MTTRKPPTDRRGRTHTARCGDVVLHITVNRDKRGEIIEVFGKANGDHQGHVDMACKLMSLGMQGRADVATLVRHMRGDRTPPCGSIGQASSIYDAIARVMAAELESE